MLLSTCTPYFIFMQFYLLLEKKLIFRVAYKIRIEYYIG